MEEGRYETHEKVGHSGKSFTEYKFKEESEFQRQSQTQRESLSRKRKATDQDAATMDVKFCTFGQKPTLCTGDQEKDPKDGKGKSGKGAKAGKGGQAEKASKATTSKLQASVKQPSNQTQLNAKKVVVK